MPYSDKIIIGNNTYNLVETTDHNADCRKKCAFRHRCVNPEYMAELEFRISTGEVVRARARPCEVIGKLANGRYTKEYIFRLRPRDNETTRQQVFFSV